jgi:hypothetical protein
MRLNPPTIQFAPSLWAAVCIVGLGVFVQKLFEFPVGTSGWQGGIAGIVLVVFGFVSIEGWWLASQREIETDAEGITIRSWLQLLAGRPGSRILWRSMSSVSLVFASGRKLEIVTPNRRYLFWVAIWNPSVLVELLQLANHNGVPTQTDWTPGS